MKVIIFAKTDKTHVKEVIEYLQDHFKNVVVYRGQLGDPFPEEAFNESSDLLISYLSPWIIPEEVLNKTKFWNINFHPGPLEYPGTGCFNFAIYNNEKFYGVVAHLMEKDVDKGKLIAVKRFPLLDSDTVYSLSIKSYGYMCSLFYEVIDYILTKNELPVCNEVWKRKPYTRRQLEELCKVEIDMTSDEIKKRIKATTYVDKPGAYIDIFGYKFEYNPER